MGASLYTRAYETATAQSTDPRHTLVLLMEGLVRFLHQAREAMQRADHEGQCESIIRAQRILSTLMMSLDRDAAPELSANLWGLYSWMHGGLTEACIHSDDAMLAEVLQAATGLHEAWRQAWQDVTTQESAA